MSSTRRQVLVVGGALQRDDLQVLVVVDRAVEELHLRTRLAFEVQDLLGPIVDVDERLALVVLRDELAGARRDAEAEHARAGVGGREAHAHGRRLAVGRQLHLLRPDDAALVFDVERHRLAGVAGLRDDRVDHQRRALERGRGVDTRSIWTSLVSDSRPTPTVNTGTLAAFMASSASEQLGVGRVRAVGHQDETRQRQAGELLPRAVERRAELRLRAREGELRRRRQPLGGRGEAEGPQDEAARQRSSGRRPRASRKCCFTNALRGWPSTSAICMLRESSTSTPRKFCWGTAALTTSTGRKRQKRTTSSVASRMRHQDRAMPRVALAAGAAIRPDRQRDRDDDDGGGNVRAGRGHEAELALLKDDRPVIEQQPKETIEHACPPWQEIEPAQAWIV